MTVARIIQNKIGTVITAAPAENMRTAAERMARHAIGALVIVDAGASIVGMVLEADVVRVAATGDEAMARTVIRDVMRNTTLTCTPDTTEADLMTMMSGACVHHIPVVSNGRLAGVVSLGDVVRLRVEKIREVMADIERQVDAERFTTNLQRRRNVPMPAALARAG